MGSQRSRRAFGARRWMAFLVIGAGATLAAAGALTARAGARAATVTTPYLVLAANDLGMHCGQSDYSEMLILPPFNTLRAQVIRRSGGEPNLVTSGVTVKYAILNNTHSADKTNFWDFSFPALGAPMPDVGITGTTLQGTMAAPPSGTPDFAAVGIPITPIDDSGREVAYNIATVSVERNGSVVASTQAIVPVSTEMSCNLCHSTPGVSTATDILRAHDRLHGTNLESRKPVMCAECHSDNALGAPGQAGVSSLSSAMHTAHASRMSTLNLTNTCYACHPGVRTNCQRDIHSARGMTCTSCHGGMAQVGAPTRQPWLQEPSCGSCHQARRPTFDFEQPGVLFRNAIGHKGVKCISCHSSPHAITPAVTETDNIQAGLIQNHTGVINDCTACHSNGPPGAFFHKVED